MYVCMYEHLYVRICIYGYVSTGLYVRMYVCMYMYMYVPYLYEEVCVYVWQPLHMHLYEDIYTRYESNGSADDPNAPQIDPVHGNRGLMIDAGVVRTYI